ncbi:hypothetical protein L3Q82_000952 [Scortum barcoo]|uniref:Uncharacterized protein n=1 Tax=Scortum barcoo TaxID=214431 RepID=A0ACB8WAY7_9TELE|nr:hypothetical protein L3Q82_000952 [Scortum barcoo]
MSHREEAPGKTQDTLERLCLRVPRKSWGSYRRLTLNLCGCSILQDVRALERGMEMTRREFTVEKDNPVLQKFLSSNTELLQSLIADGKTAQDAYDSAVEYFGENSKTTPPSMFFPVFVRFIKAYKQAEQEIEQRKRHVLNCDALSTPTKPEVTTNKVPVTSRLPQMDLIAELKKRQVSPLVREGKDGAIEDIITALKSVPFTARSAKRSSRLFCDSVFSDEPSCIFRVSSVKPELFPLLLSSCPVPLPLSCFVSPLPPSWRQTVADLRRSDSP